MGPRLPRPPGRSPCRSADNVIYGIPGRPLDTVTAFLVATTPDSPALRLSVLVLLLLWTIAVFRVVQHPIGNGQGRERSREASSKEGKMDEMVR